MQVAGIQVAGIQVAGIQVAGMQVAGIQVAGMQVAGIWGICRHAPYACKTVFFHFLHACPKNPGRKLPGAGRKLPGAGRKFPVVDFEDAVSGKLMVC